MKNYDWQVVADFHGGEPVVIFNCFDLTTAENGLAEVLANNFKWYRKTSKEYLNLSRAFRLRIVTPEEQQERDSLMQSYSTVSKMETPTIKEEV